jgi:hypothetical protein
MQNLIKVKNIEYKKLVKIVLSIFLSPFAITVLNLLLSTIFNLGIYTGTFLRFLYSIVVY